MVRFHPGEHHRSSEGRGHCLAPGPRSRSHKKSHSCPQEGLIAINSRAVEHLSRLGCDPGREGRPH